MSYSDYLGSISRIPVNLVKITCESCSLKFGIAPCTATGNKCYNTFATCKDRVNYAATTRVVKFTDTDVSSVISGAFPLLQNVNALSTEIKPDKLITGRDQYTLVDDTDSDLVADPYWSSRGYSSITDVPGTFWKRFLARNPNLKGDMITRHHGFLGMPEVDYEPAFTGKIDSISKTQSGISINAVDLLKDLSKIDKPEKNAHKLVSDMTTAITSLTVSDDISEWNAAGYVRIDSELIYYSARDVITRQLTGLVRGKFSTTAAVHNKNTRVQLCRYYYGNPFDILVDMLKNDAGIPTAQIDIAAFEEWRDLLSTDINFEAIISESTKLNKLYFEVVEQINCRSWVNESGKITIRRNFPNFPDLTGTQITDDYNIEVNTPSVDLNDDSRITRISLYNNGNYLKSNDEEENYQRLDISIDADAEGPEFNEKLPKTIYSRWIHTTNQDEDLVIKFIKNYLARILFSKRNATAILSFSTELKDASIKTGDIVRISTDELVYPDGNSYENELFLITKREPSTATIKFTAEHLGNKRVAFIAPDTTAEYASASWSERLNGFVANANGTVGTNEIYGYHIF